MDFTDQALVLRVGRFREADLWVRFLCRQRGVVSAFAFGGCRSRRRFCGCLDLFNVVLMRVQGTRGGLYQSLQEATLLKGPDRLRRDWRRCGVAVNCLRFIEALGVGPDGADAAFTLTLEMLELLETVETVPILLPLLFRARFAFEQGYAPRLESCAVCGTPFDEASKGETARFHVRDGVLYCGHCPCPSGASVALSRETLDALRFVQDNSPLRWSELCFSPAGRRECSRAVDGFIQYHIGLTWENGTYRRL